MFRPGQHDVLTRKHVVRAVISGSRIACGGAGSGGGSIAAFKVGLLPLPGAIMGVSLAESDGLRMGFGGIAKLKVMRS